MSELPSWDEFQNALDQQTDGRERYEEAVTAIRIGELIRSMREIAGVRSQSELAELMGSHQPAIARLEGGAVIPTIMTLKHVADALSCSLVVGFVPSQFSSPSLPGPTMISHPVGMIDEESHPAGWETDVRSALGAPEFAKKLMARAVGRVHQLRTK